MFLVQYLIQMKFVLGRLDTDLTDNVKYYFAISCLKSLFKLIQTDSVIIVERLCLSSFETNFDFIWYFVYALNVLASNIFISVGRI